LINTQRDIPAARRGPGYLQGKRPALEDTGRAVAFGVGANAPELEQALTD
jgi:hypothetical protein